MKEFIRSRYLILALLLLLIDILTKVAAINLLPYHESVSTICSKLTLYLTYNTGSKGSQALYMLRHEQNQNLVQILSALVAFVLMIYLLVVENLAIRKKYKWFGGIAVVIVGSVIAPILSDSLVNFEISNWTTSVITKIIGVTFYFYLFSLIKNTYIRFSFFICAVGGLCNLINHFYPPFYIVDFVDIQGAYDLLKIGTFNFADLYINLGEIALVVSIIAFVMHKLMAKRKNPTVA